MSFCEVCLSVQIKLLCNIYGLKRFEWNKCIVFIKTLKPKEKQKTFMAGSKKDIDGKVLLGIVEYLERS